MSAGGFTLATLAINPIDVAVVIVYLAVVLGLGLYQALKIRTSGDYYAGGRKFNKFYLMMHALGTASHADEPVSVIGGAYQKGLSGIWFTYLYLPLTPIFWLLAPFIRRTRFVTTADFFHVRYDRSLAVLYAVMGVLKMSVSIGLVLKSTAVVFDAATGVQPNSWPETFAVLAMTLVFVVYGFAGGLRATVITEGIQGPLIVIMSILLVPFGLYKVGGFRGLHETLDPAKFHLIATGYEFTPTWIATWTLIALVGWVAQPGIVAAVGSGKTELEGRIGYTYGTMIKRICAMGWVFTGLIVAAMAGQKLLSPEQVAALSDPKHRELAFGTAIRMSLPVGLLGLTFAAIFASQMATLSAQMVNSSALATRNLYKALFRPHAGDRETLIIGRVIGIFLVSLGVLLAMQLDKVADALAMLLGFSSIMGVVVWSGVFWRRANSAGAWASVLVLFATWAAFGPVGGMIRKSLASSPAWLGAYADQQFIFDLAIRYLPAGVAVLVVVSLVTPRVDRKRVEDFFMLLRTPVGQEQKLIDAGVPIVYAGQTQGNYWETHHPRLVHWGGFLLACAISAAMLGLLLLLARIGA